MFFLLVGVFFSSSLIEEDILSLGLPFFFSCEGLMVPPLSPMVGIFFLMFPCETAMMDSFFFAGCPVLLVKSALYLMISFRFPGYTSDPFCFLFCDSQRVFRVIYRNCSGSTTEPESPAVR